MAIEEKCLKGASDGSAHCPCMDGCPLDTTVEIVGGKWNLKVLCLLYMQGTMRFNQLKNKIDGITPTMLSKTLHELDNAGIVRRRQFDEMPVRVEYSLTEKGKSLMPLLAQIREWTIEHLQVSPER